MPGGRRGGRSSSNRHRAFGRTAAFNNDDEPEVKHITPADQLKLTKPQMEEEQTRVLQAVDPNKHGFQTYSVSELTKVQVKDNQAYDFKHPRGEENQKYIISKVDKWGTTEDMGFEFAKAGFVKAEVASHTAAHLQLKSIYMPVTEETVEVRRLAAEEAKRLEEEEKAREEALKKQKMMGLGFGEPTEKAEEKKPEDGEANPEEDAAAAGEEGDEADEGDAKPGKKLKNQFNYSERACQTNNNPRRDRAIQTEPPDTMNFAGQVTKWMIYDHYVNETLRKKQAQKKAQEETTDEKDAGEGTSTVVKKRGLKEGARRVMESQAALRACKVIERLCNHQVNWKIYRDFKSQKELDLDHRKLWYFSTSLSKGKTVTAIEWNTVHTDLFVVGYGSYDFMKQNSGLISCYTLKNTSFPEFQIEVESGVMCLDWHPVHHALLAVGCYDGSVAVYDVRMDNKTPIYQARRPEQVHQDPVWEIRWKVDEHAPDKSFFTVSSDGEVREWFMTSSDLKREDIMTFLKPEAKKTTPLNPICIDFNPTKADTFLVGTEQGDVFQCNKSFTSEITTKYDKHAMAVYAIRWNPFCDDIFLTCSEDWTVRLWDTKNTTPIITYDLGAPVQDVCWAPFCSTTFVAGTSDGKVHFFNLLVNKNAPVVSEKLIKKTKLTRCRFSPEAPLLIVGNDRGTVTSLKLVPSVAYTRAPRGDYTELQKPELFQKERDELQKVLKVTGRNVHKL